MTPTKDPLQSSHPSPATLGQLRESTYRYRSVKQELRENLITRLRDGGQVFPGIHGYEDTVVPQISHALLAHHDMLLLGLRGQAKTRILRMLPTLLDEWVPIIADLDLPDDPLVPATMLGKRRVAELGDDTPIHWLHREDRYHEKLATPDVTIADLLGEIDIVKHAEGRHLSDESTMHFGLVPRSNRGIFAINELPDLAPRIQVGLFNVLEERDVQIRGYPIRLNLDLALVFSANPEDYTNRGRIVTPLKDRIGSVVRTHYPLTLREGMRITAENAWLDRAATNGQAQANEHAHETAMPKVVVPHYLQRVIEEAIVAARTSSHINQASGVSVRTSIACLETVVSSAERRGIMTGEPVVTARVCDVQHVLSSTRGKIELMMADDSEQAEDRLVASLLGEAVKKVFDEIADVEDYEALGLQFDEGLRLNVGDSAAAKELVASMAHVDGLTEAAAQIADLLKEPGTDDLGSLAGAGELLLEALYVHNRLSKHTSAGGVAYGR